MKSSTQLESAVFQLTPTRTRCDLVITANGKTEKIASGLVNPFLAHLKTAQDQMDKGGYSIILQPESGSDASWFTKATVERFVRFVSTPEILERVYTLESEILQIEEAIAIQSNNDIGLNLAEGHQKKSVERVEGKKPSSDSNDEKAIVLYEPGAHTPAANGSTAPEGNSKLQLMKVLETRKTALQKEQGMAFARAVAAGFDIDHMTPLVSFAESFGAQRLMDACMRFKGLWKRKHETGQWVEIEAAEEMSSRSDFSTINTSGIVLSDAVNSENNGKADGKASVEQQQLPSHQEYFQGQYPLPMYPPWPIHSPPGGFPAFQGYPMQGIPYYQNYPGNGPMFQPPYPTGEDHKRRLRRHSMDSNIEPETWEADAMKARSQDDVDLERETFGGREPGRKGGRSSKKQSGRVVIRNINYITSKRQDSSGSESQSASETDEDGNSMDATSDMKRNDSVRSSKRKDNHASNEETAYGKEADGGQWQAFQTYLLKDADEAERAIDQNMFTMEKDVQLKRRQNTVADDPLLLNGRGAGENQEGIMRDIRRMSGNLTHMRKMTNDELLISRRTGQPSDGTSMDVESAELYRRRGGYRMTGNDDFLVHRKGEYGSPSDSLAINGFERANSNNRLSANANDDSYIVSLRSMSVHQTETDERNAFDMDSEFPSSIQRAENSSNNVGNQVKYEPDALSLMPERETEKRLAAYDPALDYGMEVHMDKRALLDKKNKVGIPDKQGSKKTDKDRKSRLVPGTSDKKTVGPIRKGKLSKLSPLDEAKARAERLRTYKADLQKIKKEKEAEEIRRLEALKLERQKRIAARGSSIAAQSATPQTKKQTPIKLSPSSHRASKFTDAEPGSSSPLQRSRVRTISAGSNDSLKASKSGKLSARSNSAGNRLTQSVSSLPEPKKDNAIATPDTKTSMAKTRRLSEPTKSSGHQVSSVKAQSAEPVSKPKVSNGQESKKISAIMNHDKSKAASLPELKIRPSKTLGILDRKSATKDLLQKENGSKSFTASEGTEPRSNRDKVSHHSDGDDNPIVEKTVVMLECEKPSVPTVCKSGGNVGVQGHSDSLKMADRNDTVSEYAAIRAPVSQPTLDRVDRESIEHQRQRKPSDYVVITENASNPVKESPVFSSIDVPEKPYQAPYARVSSLEDKCTRNSEYGKAPAMSLQTETSPEILKVHVSDSRSLKLERIPETSDRPQTKESSKGFRRLLKFGRKNHASADHNTESDYGSVNGSEADDRAADVGSSSEVHTLKNLISQDETPTAVTPQKTSRHFSLLSPFRSKTSEKKQTA